MAGLHRDIESLEEGFQQRVRVLLARLDQLGIKYRISETLRDIEVQRAYYAQGREPLVTVNRLRSVAGLWPLSEEENKRQITWTMQSRHLEGKAIDLVPSVNGTFWWTAPDSKWKEIAEVAKELGFDAGYYWKKHDSPHIQLKE